MKSLANMLDKIDDAVFGVVDRFFLWLWNETGVAWRDAMVPADAMSALNVARRRGAVARAIRALELAILLSDLPSGDWRPLTDDGLGMVLMLAIYAAAPSGPRQPKRRPKTLLTLARGAA